MKHLSLSYSSPHAGQARDVAAALVLGWALLGSAQGQPNRDHGHGHGHGQGRQIEQRVETSRWYDAGHGNNRYYPRPGWAVVGPPPRSQRVFWGGVNYRYVDSVWYAPRPRGYVVVRPPFGAVIIDRPAFFSLVTIGSVAYLYANGVYYREHRGGGYEVVPSPAESAAAQPPQPKAYVYPRQAQGAEQQASDEYDCHRWAVSQTGFDPTAAATGQKGGGSQAERDNYQRATNACLEGRGYTVR